MARIRPFAGWRYTGRDGDLTAVVAPPYDVVSAEQRAELLEGSEYNIVALELPDGPLDPSAEGNRYDTGSRTWEEWRASGVLAKDDAPAVYVLEQSYELAGRRVRRRAFIVEVGLEPFDAGVVLPHERTLPKALGDRFELIKATGANFSQVFGLFDDPQCLSSGMFDSVMAAEPDELATDADGVLSRLWVSTDPQIALSLAGQLAESQIFIADGHHRYTTALAYRDMRRAERGQDPSAPAGDAPYDYVMMALVNMDDPDLVVLPTHRVADAAGAFDADAFKEALARTFVIEELAVGHPTDAMSGLDEPAFLFKTREDERPLLARLRADAEVDALMPGPASHAWKMLDVAVLQELVLDPLLGIHPDRPETLDRLSFVKDPHDAFKATSRHDVTFVLRPTRMDQLRAVAIAGETMPQKSTYFYPKLLSGLVVRAAE